jgi:restriction system protein
MARIIFSDGEEFTFDPFAKNIDKHFSQVCKNIYDVLLEKKVDMKWRDYKKIAKDGSDRRLTTSDYRERKKDFCEDVVDQFERRGLKRLKEFKTEAIGDSYVEWDKMKKIVRRTNKPPEKPKDKLKDLPREPSKSDPKFQPDIGFLGRLFGYNEEDKKKKAEEKFEKEHKRWRVKKEKIRKYNNRILKKWKEKKSRYESKKNEREEKIESAKENYDKGDEEIVETIMLAKIKTADHPDRDIFSDIREIFGNNVKVRYVSKTKNLIVDYEVPHPQKIPKIEKIKYNKRSDKFEEVKMKTDKWINIVEKIFYGMPLRLASQVFWIDRQAGSSVDSIVANITTNFTNRSTGIQEKIYKSSLKCDKDEVSEMRLSQVDPELAFDNLGGTVATSLRGDSGVDPIMHVDVAEATETTTAEADSTENLATMGWERFEHLIGDLFEKEFGDEGEVNVTQASQDGGIDAIAHDPDPLRGGKIVIQAKRYTQTVGVAAVRDLYGTAMSEDATKGVLVTTSEFSASAHDFAQGKPIQLLNGDDLLRLLDRHGYDARVDLEEARSQTEG